MPSPHPVPAPTRRGSPRRFAHGLCLSIFALGCVRREKKPERTRNFAPKWLDLTATAVIVPATFRPSARNDSTGERRPLAGAGPAAGLGNLPRAVVHAVKGDAGYVPAVHRGSLARGGGDSRRSVGRTGPEHHRHGSVHIRGGRGVPDTRQQDPFTAANRGPATPGSTPPELGMLRRREPRPPDHRPPRVHRLERGRNWRSGTFVETDRSAIRATSVTHYEPGWNVELDTASTTARDCSSTTTARRRSLVCRRKSRRAILRTCPVWRNVPTRRPQLNVAFAGPQNKMSSITRPTAGSVYGIWNAPARWTSSSPSATRR